MTRRILSLLACLLVFAAPAQALQPAEIAAPDTLATVPDALRAWVPWVMGDEEPQDRCPRNAGRTELCQWGTRLGLSVSESGGEFRYAVALFDEGWVELPGDKGAWPQDVALADGRKLPVILRQNRPMVFLEEGSHVIAGKMRWDDTPDMLRLPARAGLVSLTVDGQPRPFLTVDGQFRLWIRNAEQAAETAKGEADAMKVQYFRLLQDDIPLRVDTVAHIEVAGKSREEQLKGMVLDGFVPMQVTGNLPTRLESDGTLRVQVKPGTHQLTVTSYLAEPRQAFTLPAERSEGRAQEIWSFDDRPELRVAQAEGAPAIDPAQTEMPRAWRVHPAYIMDGDTTLNIAVKKRGLETLDPDRLRLSRILQLDSDGAGYTVRDSMHGTLSRSWRLTAQPATELGRVRINGQPQFITRLTDDPAAPRGVEVRPGSLNLDADSRLEERGTFPARLPAIGWQHDMDTLSATLRLPAGWSLLGAQGADSVSASWVKSWSLLDVFLVLVAVVACFRLMGAGTALVLAVALVLIHPENAFFTSVALTVLLVMALLRVVPQGRFHTGLTFLRRFMLLCFVLAALPFMVMHMRDALYPQLKQPAHAQTFANVAGGMTEQAVHYDAAPPAPARAPAPPLMESLASGISPRMKSAVEVKQEAQQMVQQLYQYDANTNVQTGFGVPDHYSGAVRLGWNGPVEQGDALTLWLLSPAMNLWLALLRLLLLALVFVFLLGIPLRGMRGGNMPRRMREALAVALLGGGALLHAPPAVAQAAPPPAPVRAAAQDGAGVYPPAALLEELRARIKKEMAENRCERDCVAVARTKVFAAADELTVFLELHVGEDKAAVPLPGGVRNWRPATVTVNGAHATRLTLDNGHLHLSLPEGVHDVVLSGPLPAGDDSIGLRFPLAPGFAEAAAVGWEVQGIQPGGVLNGNLQLIRLADAAATGEEEGDTLESRPLPDFFRVERTLDLGLSWQVHTVVSRITPADRAATIAVPLLAGESLMTNAVEVKDGKALLHFAAGEQARRIQSVLEPRGEILLKAPAATRWMESWRLNASSVWHVEFSGIPRVVQQNDANPGWRPWPGEEVRIVVAKPYGVEGPTLTIDNSRHTVQAGDDKAKHRLALSLRSSQAGQHELILPAGAQLQQVRIDGRDMSIQQKERSVVVPVARGEQQLELEWLQPNPMSARYRLPAVDVGAPTVNSTTVLALPQDRWLLFARGPLSGPAILIWGWLPVLLIVAVGLARVGGVPLRAHHWFLLLLGLSQTSLAVMVVVAGWFLAMSWRERDASRKGEAWFNLRQVLLGCWTVLTLLLLFHGIKHGLLGTPDMRVAGEGSGSYRLQWYQDITGAVLPQPEAISAPLWLYRVLMLLWALWLASALVGWLKWAWECFSREGYWRSAPAKATPPAAPAAPAPAGEAKAPASPPATEGKKPAIPPPPKKK